MNNSKSIEVKIFKITKEILPSGSIIFTKQTKGTIKNVECYNLNLDSYFIPVQEIRPSKKTPRGLVLKIESEKGFGNIEFPIFNNLPDSFWKKVFENYLNQKVKWKRITKHQNAKEGNGYRKISTYELYFLTGPLKNETLRETIEQ